jgi:hypothetical protein
VVNVYTGWREPAGDRRPIVRRSGLTDTDLVRAERALAMLGAGWSLDRHEDYCGDISAVIGPTADHDDAPTFSLHAAAGMVQVGVVAHDGYLVLGTRHRVEDAVGDIARYLEATTTLAA